MAAAEYSQCVIIKISALQDIAQIYETGKVSYTYVMQN